MIRTRRRSLVLGAAVVALAGCGGGAGPRLAHDDAQGLIALAHRIAGEGACPQSRDITRLRARAIALVNARKVPPALQDTLLSGVNALAAQAPMCLPKVSASQVPTKPVTNPEAPAAHPGAKPHDHGHRPGHAHGHGHGHGKKH